MNIIADDSANDDDDEDPVHQEGLCFLGQLALGSICSIIGGALSESWLKLGPEAGMGCGAFTGIVLYNHSFQDRRSLALCICLCLLGSLVSCTAFPNDPIFGAILTTFPAAAAVAGWRLFSFERPRRRSMSPPFSNLRLSESWLKRDAARFPARSLKEIMRGDGEEEVPGSASIYQRAFGVFW